MRIDRLDLLAYGRFSGTSLDLSAGQSGLHLIYGDNEAGKSTSLRALIGWLFGIPARTNDNFLHTNAQLRIGGKLRRLDGKELEFVRRKGTKGTILEFGSDTPLDEAILSPFLPAGMDEGLFTKLYGIDYTRLVAGGQELLHQSGDLSQALFSAAMGTADLRSILSELQSGAEDLFKPRASTKPVNKAIAEFKEARNRIKEASLPVSEWKQLQKDLADTRADIKGAEDEITEKLKENSRLDRCRRIQGAMAERRAVLAGIAELGNVLLLPEDFEGRLKGAVSDLRTAGETRAMAEAKLLRLKEESASLNLRHELLENEEEILAIYKEWGAVEKTLADRPQQDGKRRQLRNEAQTLLKTVRPDLTLENAECLRPLLNNKKWLAGLTRKHGLLNQQKNQIDAARRDLEDEIESIESELESQTCSNLDLVELKAAVAVARKAGDLERRLAEGEKRAQDDNQGCTSELLRLGRFSGTIETLVHVAMPVDETLDGFEKRFDDIEEILRECGRRRSELEGERRQAEQELRALLLRSQVPTIAELEESRKIRNLGWHLLKRKYIEDLDVEREILDFAPGADLPGFYEQKVEVADHVSDMLRLDADQVVKRADLEAKILQVTSRDREIEEKAGKAAEEKEGCLHEWQNVWQPLGITPGKPREMKQWLLRVDKLLASVRSAESAVREARRLDEECTRLKATVSRQIATFDPTRDVGTMSLEAMISLCEQRVEQEEEHLETKRRLEHRLNEARIRLKRTAEDSKTLATDQAAWLQEWSQAIDGLGLKPNAHPEHVTELFDKLTAFFETFDRSEELRKRIYGMDQVAERFEQHVFEFVNTIGLNSDGQEASSIAARLNRDLNKAREARVSLEKIETQQKEAAEVLANADIKVRSAHECLAKLREIAAVTADEELQQAGERSRHSRELWRKLETLEQELSRNGDGLSIAELEIEAEAVDVDAIDGELARVVVELQDLQAHRDGLRDRRKTLSNEIEANDGSAAAANASEEAEQQLAVMISGAEQYLRYKIAALILEQRIEEYRKKNQAPVLAKAGALFARLTLGSYGTIRGELDSTNKAILLGVRPDDQEVHIEGMSEGSRDQLFLALRLATLMQHLRRGEPMPFVVDDILLGFDDRRTSACLEVLAELAAETQVLLFTHHRRVMELAEPLKVQAGIYLHEL